MQNKNTLQAGFAFLTGIVAVAIGINLPSQTLAAALVPIVGMKGAFATMAWWDDTIQKGPPELR